MKSKTGATAQEISKALDIDLENIETALRDLIKQGYVAEVKE